MHNTGKLQEASPELQLQVAEVSCTLIPIDGPCMGLVGIQLGGGWLWG
jgi:hypothetical protein